MKRKDCDQKTFARRHVSGRTPAPGRPCRARVAHDARRFNWLAMLPIVGLAFGATHARAGSIRVWPTSVTVDEKIRLGDLCELRGFPSDEETKLREAVVSDAPPPGGSRLIQAQMIRDALAQVGANAAFVTLSGAVECAVSRPARLAQESRPPQDDGAPTAPAEGEHAPSETLRQVVIDYFNNELFRYGGTAEVRFDHSAEQILSLCGPEYQFEIRRRAGQALGTIALEVGVMANGTQLQTAPLVVQLTMKRDVVVARRTINQDATITKSDVDLVNLTFTRVDEPGMGEVAQAIGQRAKRVIPAGAYLTPDLLEKVPLVLRGQLVTLTSVEGGISIVTTAKAMADAHVGEVIKVRSVDDSHVEMDAIVTGPGEVRVGKRLQMPGPSMLAQGDN